MESFATCMVAGGDKKKEEFGNQQAVRSTEALLAMVLTIMFYVGVALLVAFIGSTLWNETLVPAVSVVKKVGTVQILGIYLLVRFFLM